MRDVLLRARCWRIVWVMFLAALSLGLIASGAIPATYVERRETAQQLWKSQSITSYHIVVRAFFAGRVCAQEIEVRGTRQYVLRDTCNSSWLSSLTVDRLFELSARLEAGPECFPSQRDCVCQRVRAGSIEYHPDHGFPSTIGWRREMQPNWQHPAYWKRVWQTHELPNCASPVRSLRLEVVSLTPLYDYETPRLYHASPAADGS
ncbi:hypothetical protein [Roseiflexus sp.]|uniref:hypothetical protein n=1 Tax=Roseiflexus sp. TaxID=2562120 RepID=UPI00398B6E87